MSGEIVWSTATRGERIVPIALVAGIPAIFTPENLPSVTGTTLGTTDALWWPAASGAVFNTYAKPWLSIVDGYSWTESAKPADASLVDVASITLTLSDVALAATTLFASRDLAQGSYITQEVALTDTTIHVVSTSGFASNGVFYLGREAINYTGTTATTFTGCSRGVFGSQPQRHFYSASNGLGLGNPEVTDRPVEVVGRLATLWLARIDSSGRLDALSLQYVGHVGNGPVLTDDNERWTLSIDHAVKRLGQKPRAPAVTVGGYYHDGNLGGRSVYDSDGTPVYGVNLTSGPPPAIADYWQEHSGSPALAPWQYVIVLTGDAAYPDNGGWHPSRESYIEAINAAAASVVTGTDRISYSLQEDLLVCSFHFASTQGGTLNWSWDQQHILSPATSGVVRSAKPMPEAYVPIESTGTRLYLSDTDYATIPPAPAPEPTDAICWWGLAWEEQEREGSPPAKRTVFVRGYYSAGGVNAVDVVPAEGTRYRSITTLPGGSARGTLFLSKPTTMRVILYVSAASWVPAIRNAVTVFSDDLADGTAQVFDWDRIAAVAQRYAPVIQGVREFVIDNDTSILSLVSNECAIQGFSLVPYKGRIAIARIADYAVTEPRVVDFVTADLVGDAAPSYSRGTDGIVNTMTVDFPAARVKYTFTDQTSRAAYGPSQSTIEVTVPGGLFDRAIGGAELTTTLAAMAMSTLGPLRFPYEHVGITTSLLHADIFVGDVVGLTLWRVPNQSAGRGLVGRAAQVMERTPSFYRDGTGGDVKFTLRLCSTNISGWAPGAFVAAGGITGAVVSLDTTTFGSNGCAISGIDGGAATFTAGDAVLIYEVGTGSPATAIHRTVLSVSGSTLTLDTAPGATWVTLAASACKVVIMYDDWGNGQDSQRVGWAYLADSANELVKSTTATRARVYAP